MLHAISDGSPAATRGAEYNPELNAGATTKSSTSDRSRATNAALMNDRVGL